MMRIITGSSLFIGGCVVFAACMICVSFEGVVPSDVQSERLLAVFLMLVGAAAMIWEAWREKNK